LPFEEQNRVNLTISKGATYLTGAQGKDGSWGGNVGHTALAGLALLECGAPVKDPRDLRIPAAAAFVRKQWAKLDGTYELALAILFLDRVGDPKDNSLIRTFALRLIAGQTTTGGWAYKCPILSPELHRSLFTTLEQLREQDAHETFPGLSGGPSSSTGGGPGGKLPPIAPTDKAPGDKPVADKGIGGGPYSPSDSAAGSARLPRRGYCIKMAEVIGDEPPSAEQPPKPVDPGKPKPKRGKVVIPKELNALPVLQEAAKFGVDDPRGKGDSPPHTGTGSTDNSNTQFAILGLWAAQRHGVPMDRSLRLIVNRFRTSQGAEGGWNYNYAKGGGGSTPAMSCAGLIGLAVGYGLANNAKVKPGAPKQQVPDKLLLTGFRYLVKQLGDPAGRMYNLPVEQRYNFYFLWSVERVAVLFNLKTIGRKDWYRWGAEILVANQANDGSWPKGEMPGGDQPVVNSSLALLFLRGANLASDLTSRLPFSPQELTGDIDAKPTPTPAPAPPPPVVETPPKKGPVDSLPSSGDSRGDLDLGSDSPKKSPEANGEKKPDTASNPGAGEAPAPSASKPAKEESDNTWLIIAACAGGGVLLLGGVGLGIFLLTRGGKKEKEQPRKQRRYDDDDDQEEERPRARKAAPARRKSSNVRRRDD
jgi:hypothetical protein